MLRELTDEMKNAEIDDHIEYTRESADEDGHIFLLPYEERGKKQQKGNVKPYVKR